MIRPQVITRSGLDGNRRLLRKLSLDGPADLVRELSDSEILVPGVERLAGNLLDQPLDEIDVQVGDVVDVNIRPLLRAAEDSDLASVDRVVRQD